MHNKRKEEKKMNTFTRLKEAFETEEKNQFNELFWNIKEIRIYPVDGGIDAEIEFQDGSLIDIYFEPHSSWNTVIAYFFTEEGKKIELSGEEKEAAYWFTRAALKNMV